MRAWAIWSVKSGSVGNTRLLPRAKMLLVPMNFSLTGRGVYILTEQTMLPLVSCWEVVTCILIFCGYCLWSAWLVICPPMQKHSLWPLLKRKVLHCGQRRVLGFALIFSKVPPWSEWLKAKFFVRECDGFLQWVLSRWAELVSVLQDVM